MNSILIIQTGFLGDVVLSTPVIAAMKELYPSSKITFLTTPQAKDLLLDNPDLHEVLVYDKRGADAGITGLFRLAKLLKSKGFTKAFSLHKSYRTSLMLFLSRIPERIGFFESNLNFLYTKKSKRSDLKHEVLRNLAIFRSLNIPVEDKKIPLKICLGSEFLEANKNLLAEFTENFIAVSPSSVWATKEWTAVGFSSVVKYYLSNGIGVALLGSPTEVEKSKKITLELGDLLLAKDPSGSKLFQDFTGKLSLRQSAFVISKAKVLLCNDSSPLHIASAMGTPVVSIFCATVPEQGFTPWMVKHEIVELKGLECRPCGRHGGQTCPLGTNACQLGISQSMVISAIKKLLD